jgi:hypothetical protein
MNKNVSKKLNLRRETLAPLQANDLYDVAGGQATSLTTSTTTTTTSTTTITACPTMLQTLCSCVTLPNASK